MRARMRVCTEPGCGAMQTAARCAEHQRAIDRRQRSSTPTKVFGDRDRRRRKAFVAAHRARYGDWCPGFEVAPHSATDLTADHTHELQAGGRWDGPLAVLCRSCNSRKARRTQLALAAGPHGGTPAEGSGAQPRGRSPNGAEGSNIAENRRSDTKSQGRQHK